MSDIEFAEHVGLSKTNNPPGLSPLIFEAFRAEYVRQWEARLTTQWNRAHWRRYELPVSGGEISEQLRRVYGKMRGVRGKKKDRYSCSAIEVSANFNEGQRRVLFWLLEELIEASGWRINLGRCLDAAKPIEPTDPIEG